MNEQAATEKTPKTRSPLLIKGASVVCPGIGQFLEKRYAMGAVHLLLFLGLMLAAFAFLVLWGWESWQLISRQQGQANLKSPTLLKMSGCMMGCLIVWVWSIVDAGRSQAAPQPPPAEAE